MQAPVQRLTNTAALRAYWKGTRWTMSKVIARFCSAHFIQAGERAERPPIPRPHRGPNRLRGWPSPLTCSPPHSQGSSQRQSPTPVLRTPASHGLLWHTSTGRACFYKLTRYKQWHNVYPPPRAAPRMWDSSISYKARCFSS